MLTVTLARKPLIGSVVQNVLSYGVGTLHIDASRVAVRDLVGVTQSDPSQRSGIGRGFGSSGATGASLSTMNEAQLRSAERANRLGRWPANLLISHSAGCGMACVTGCPVLRMDEASGVRVSKESEAHHFGGDEPQRRTYSRFGRMSGRHHGDSGGASRFFKQFGRVVPGVR